MQCPCSSPTILVFEDACSSQYLLVFVTRRGSTGGDLTYPWDPMPFSGFPLDAISTCTDLQGSESGYSSLLPTSQPFLVSVFHTHCTPATEGSVQFLAGIHLFPDYSLCTCNEIRGVTWPLCPRQGLLPRPSLSTTSFCLCFHGTYHNLSLFLMCSLVFFKFAYHVIIGFVFAHQNVSSLRAARDQVPGTSPLSLGNFIIANDYWSAFLHLLW